MGRNEGIGIIECGLPVRRGDGVNPCVLEAGHRGAFCQDRRALFALENLTRVQGQAREGRALLSALGLRMGVTTAQKLAMQIAWEQA